VKHLALAVADQERSRRFYETYFGFDAQPSRWYDGGVLMLYNAEGFSLALGANERGDQAAGLRPLRESVFQAATQFSRFVTALAADGVRIVEEWDERDHVSVKCFDPDGYVVEAAWESPRR
jgi:catechol 2,3-dioxygenase-like lactoylglutathione lyase family enzyme